MENNITNFVDNIKKDNPTIDPYSLYLLIKDDEKLALKLCDAAFITYENIEHIKKMLIK